MKKPGFYARYAKRALDILLALLGLPVLGLICLFVAPAIRLSDGGPVFYLADRLGYKGRIFRMYKFRSMKVNAPDVRLADGSTYNAEDDPRLTPIGGFLRKTSLDETPQLLNVLLGDMSFVGPRPDLPGHRALYTGNEPDKLLVRPGITGLSQARYRNSVPWKMRLTADVEYAHDVRFKQDAAIVWQTIKGVLRGQNINAVTGDDKNASGADDGPKSR